MAATAADPLLPALRMLFQESALLLQLHPRAKQHADESGGDLYGWRRGGEMVWYTIPESCREALPFGGRRGPDDGQKLFRPVLQDWLLPHGPLCWGCTGEPVAQLQHSPLEPSPAQERPPHRAKRARRSAA